MGQLVGYETEKDTINLYKRMLLNPEEFAEKGVHAPKGLLLFGEPGVGKTQLARMMADEKINFFELRAADCCNDEGGEMVEKIFKDALDNQPAVILLDELDKIAGTSGEYFMEKNFNIQKILLQSFDTIPVGSQVFVVATCNDVENLGDALLRSGRFDKQINVEMPDEQTRGLILSSYLEKVKLENTINITYASRLLAGYTGADIECLVNAVAIMVMEKGRSCIRIRDLLEAMNEQTFKGSTKSPIKDKTKLHRVAVHEAGHVLAAMCLNPDCLFSATVIPQGKSNGHIQFINPNKELCSVRELETDIIVALAGRAAEKIILKEYLAGSGSDLSKAYETMEILVAQAGAYGLDFLSFGSNRYDAAENLRNAKHEVVVKHLNRLNDDAEKLILEHMDIFTKIEEALEDRQVLSKSEIIACFPDNFDFIHSSHNYSPENHSGFINIDFQPKDDFD